MRSVASRLAVLIAVSGAGVPVVQAAGSRIDPVPGSPLLSELVEREAAALRPLPQPAPRTEAPPARSQPHVPRGAVTVIVPGGRLR